MIYCVTLMRILQAEQSSWTHYNFKASLYSQGVSRLAQVMAFDANTLQRVFSVVTYPAPCTRQLLDGERPAPGTAVPLALWALAGWHMPQTRSVVGIPLTALRCHAGACAAQALSEVNASGLHSNTICYLSAHAAARCQMSCQ